MLLFILICLVIGQLWFEVKLTRALHLEAVSARIMWVNLGISVLITMGCNKLFGASAGMVTVSAGILSTILSQPMYNVMERYAKFKALIFSPKFTEDIASAKQLATDTWKMIRIICRIITFPIWGYRGIKAWCSQQRMRFAR